MTTKQQNKTIARILRIVGAAISWASFAVFLILIIK